MKAGVILCRARFVKFETDMPSDELAINKTEYLIFKPWADYQPQITWDITIFTAVFSFILLFSRILRNSFCIFYKDPKEEKIRN